MRLRLDRGHGAGDWGPGTGGPGISAGLGSGRSKTQEGFRDATGDQPGLDQCKGGDKPGIKVKRTEVFLAAMGQIE